MSGIDTREVAQFAGKLGGVDALVRREARGLMSKSLDVLEDAIVQRTPVNTGALRSATSKESLSVGNAIRGQVINPLNYALPVETGRKAGKMPPVDAIKQWVIRKGIASGADADGAAFLIARAIGRRGTKGAHMFEEGFNASLPRITSLWNDLPGRIVRGITQ